MIPFHYSRMKCSIPELELDFVVGFVFAATFAELIQSQLFFDIDRIFCSQVIFAFTNRTLKYKYLPVSFFSHAQHYTESCVKLQGLLSNSFSQAGKIALRIKINKV